MAATPLDAAAPTSFAFDIYDDAAAAAASSAHKRLPPPPPPPLTLPIGPCNFVDLTHGSSGTQCGCRRFWSRSAGSAVGTPLSPSFGFPPAPGAADAGHDVAAADANNAGWCMCSHHACFHDHTPGCANASDRTAPTSFFTSAATPSFLDQTPSLPQQQQLLLPPPPPPPQTLSSSTVTGQENEPPRPHRMPLSPVAGHPPSHADGAAHDQQALLELSFGFPSDVPAHLDSSFAAMMADAAAESRRLIMAADAEDNCEAVHEDDAGALAALMPTTNPASAAVSVSGPPADDSIPDTMSFCPSRVSMAAAIAATRAPGPAAGVALSVAATATTSSSSQMRAYMRPFAGRGLQTLSQHPAVGGGTFASSLGPLLEDRHDDASTVSGLSHAHAPPSVAGSLSGSVSGSVASTALHRRPVVGFNSLAGVVQAHEARLGKLENPSQAGLSSASPPQSFVAATQAALEDGLERYDHMDMRMTEIESRLDEVEKRQESRDDAPTPTVVSTTTSIASASSHHDGRSRNSSSSNHQALLRQLQTLQNHVSELQAAAAARETATATTAATGAPHALLPLPISRSNPWTLEVVFVPFPLKGLWVEAGQFKTTAAAAAAAAAAAVQRSGASGTAVFDDEWTAAAAADPSDAGARLLPKACAPGSIIDRRLESRGLVKTLSVYGGDARSLQEAMAEAFGPVLVAMATPFSSSSSSSSPSPTSTSPLHHQFLGLQQSWVPLRKVYKDSRLRFLTRAEMLTPALWDAAFLDASVVMKGSGGRHRLYVTQPDAYLQDRRAYVHGWTWQRLQTTLPAVALVDAEKGNRDCDHGGGDDACWAWDSRLDEPPLHPSQPPALPPALPRGSSSSSISSPALSRMRESRRMLSRTSMSPSPSPSPFSRDTTPTGHRYPHHRHDMKPPASTGQRASSLTPLVLPPAPAPPPTPRGALPPLALAISGATGSGGSTEQFFTVAQSPSAMTEYQQHGQLMSPSTGATGGTRVTGATFPTAPVTLRRSLSPFVASTLSLPAMRRSTLPPPTTLSGRSATAASSGVRKARRVHSAGSVSRGGFGQGASSHQSTAASHQPTMPIEQRIPAYRRSTSGVDDGDRRIVRLERRRSTRSPSSSAFWPQHTPRYSRSPSAVPTVTFQNLPPQSQPQYEAGPQVPQQAACRRTVSRGTTPAAACYATPHSNAAAPFADLQAHPSSVSSRRWRRRMERVRRGSGPGMAAYGAGYGNGNGYGFGYNYGFNEDDNDNDLIMGGFDSDEFEDFDDPMTGEESEDGGEDDEPIAVYEDRDDEQRPEDQLWPGIETDHDDVEVIGVTARARTVILVHEDDGDDEDVSMSDSENWNPLSLPLSLFGDGNDNAMAHTHAHAQPPPPPSPPSHHSDQASSTSSQPSEYPSTRRPGPLPLPDDGGVPVRRPGSSRESRRSGSRRGDDRVIIIVDDDDDDDDNAGNHTGGANNDIGFTIHEDGDVDIDG